MNPTRLIAAILITAFSFALLISPVFAVNATQPSSPAGQISIVDVRMEPQIFMRGDTGIVTITVKNTGTESVMVKRATFAAKEIATLNYDTYATSVMIGPGNTMDFAYTMRADPVDGIYYPRFYLDLGTESYRSYIPLRIESTPIDLSVKDRPDYFIRGVKEEITLVVGNPRENTLSGVTVTPLGDGILSSQTRAFIGDLAPGASREVKFGIGSNLEGNITFFVEYRNGMNTHHRSIDVPVVFGASGKEANPLINNIEITSAGGTYTLSADVTNAGLSDARSIVVTVGAPAQPTDPYPVYIVGTLEPDDFSSFDVTFIAPGLNAVPVILTYRDEKGNEFSKRFEVSLRGGSMGSNSTAIGPQGGTGFQGGSTESFRQTRGGNTFMGLGSGFARIPLLEMVLVVIAAIAVLVAWRKGFIGRILGRLRR
ncbi:MAG: hypothetical protein QHG99_06340 [Methanomicrobiales archaeon]|nr:hypothetical protein [Methanomicrobiales archaeon]